MLNWLFISYALSCSAACWLIMLSLWQSGLSVVSIEIGA